MIKIAIVIRGHLQNCRSLSVHLVHGSTKKREMGMKIGISLSPINQFEGLYTLYTWDSFHSSQSCFTFLEVQRTLKVAASRF